MMVIAGFSLGSNLGDRLANLIEARRRLRTIHEGADEDFRVAPLFETAPVDCVPGAPSFLNTAIELETARPPLELLDLAQAIEQSLGRPSEREKNAPRTVDVDLIYVGGTALSDPRLELPHPRFRERRFVLLPFTRIHPDLRLPGETRTLAELLDALESEEADPVLWRSSW